MNCIKCNLAFSTYTVDCLSVMSSEVVDDITEEVLTRLLKPFGGALHIHVDRFSPQGNVFVKSVSIAQGEAAVNSLHKKEFSGNL